MLTFLESKNKLQIRFSTTWTESLTKITNSER